MSKKKISKNIQKSQNQASGSPPVAKSSVRRPTAPMFGNSTNGITIKRREFVGTASNGGHVNTFFVTNLSASTPGYDINPLCANLFPWLSHLSGCYERFKFRKLSFEFIPSQATTTAGRYYASVDYDFDDAPAASKLQFMGNMTAIEAPIWERSVMTCDPRSLSRDMEYKYISCTTRGLWVEQRTANAGYFMIGFDTPEANCLVDIWVDYEVELVTPVLDDIMAEYVPPVGHTAVTDVLTAAGTAFYGPMHTTTPYSSGRVRVVASGENEVPTLMCSVGGTTKEGGDALDIWNTLFRGALDLVGEWAVTGVTPAAIIGTNQTMFYCDLFTSSGVRLDEVWNVTANTDRNMGPKSSAELSTNSKYVKAVITISLDELRKYVPTARYLVPYLVSTVAALGAGYQAFGWRYTDA